MPKWTKVSSTQSDRRYYTSRWVKHSKRIRAQVSKCQVSGEVLSMSKLVVDHIIPVTEGGAFWDSRNHQVISIVEHNKKTARERSGSTIPYELNDLKEKIPKQG